MCSSADDDVDLGDVADLLGVVVVGGAGGGVAGAVGVEVHGVEDLLGSGDGGDSVGHAGAVGGRREWLVRDEQLDGQLVGGGTRGLGAQHHPQVVDVVLVGGLEHDPLDRDVLRCGRGSGGGGG